MKKIVTLILAAFAVTAFAQTKTEPVAVKTTPNPVVAPASAPAKNEVKPVKPVKSTPAKDEKAAVPATKPASK